VNTLRFTFLSLLAVCELFGCSKSGDEALIAKWEYGYRSNEATYLGEPGAGNPKVIIFSRDGSVSWGEERATWSWVNKGKTISVRFGPQAYNFDVQFNGQDAGSMFIRNAGHPPSFLYYRK
jgi:hypothetical protein